jgi:hypothetical protein
MIIPHVTTTEAARTTQEELMQLVLVLLLGVLVPKVQHNIINIPSTMH